MALMDEFQEERKNLVKNGSFREKAAYFWEYYKWYAIVPLVIVIALGWYIHHLTTIKDVILNGVFVNADATQETTWISDLYDLWEVNRDEEEITFQMSLFYHPQQEETETAEGSTMDEGLFLGGDTNYQTIVTLTSWMGAGTVDLVVSEEDTMEELADRAYFAFLDQILTEEELSRYGDYIIEDEKGRPLMLDLSDFPEVMSYYPKAEQPVLMAIPYKSERVDAVVRFLDFLINNNTLEGTAL